MTTVEAMQNGCVPVVIDGGGQKEIVENGVNGFRFRNEREMKKLTIWLIKDEKLMMHLSLSTKKSSEEYSKDKFQKIFKELIENIIKEIKEQKKFIPEAHEVLKNH